MLKSSAIAKKPSLSPLPFNAKSKESISNQACAGKIAICASFSFGPK
jgi:hypothetical protein